MRQQRSDRLTTADMLSLIQTARELSGLLPLEALLKRILERAGESTGSPDASVILRHEARPGLYAAAAIGDSADWVLTTFGRYSAKTIPPDEGSKAGTVFASRKPLLENRVRGHFTGVDEETKKTTQSMVCVPLLVENECIGVMQVLNRRDAHYTIRDCNVLEHFAAQAAIAIQNATLFERLMAHSGLYTGAMFATSVRALKDELQRPAREEVLSVMFADMRGFTQLCQSLQTPAERQRRLNEFLTLLVTEISREAGVVNKFMGDGVLALFRGEHHAERAVRSAFAIVESVQKLKGAWQQADINQDLDFVDVGIGITTDEVTLGAMGSESVRDFTVIGPAVNIAAQFEQSARDGNRILVDQRTYNAVRAVIAKADGPRKFVLQKAGQSVIVPYKRYVLLELKNAEKTRVFVSHCEGDRTVAKKRIILPLTEAGIRAWFAAEDIPKGEVWPAAIRRNLASCDWMVVLVSSKSKASDWVRLEVDLAMSLGHLAGRIIPVRLDDTPLQSVNEYLASMQAIDLRRKVDIAACLKALFAASSRASETSGAPAALHGPRSAESAGAAAGGRAKRRKARPALSSPGV